MKHASPTRQRLAALSLLCVPLLTFPLVGLPNGFFQGLPATYLYLFGVWGGLIGLAMLVAEGKKSK